VIHYHCEACGASCELEDAAAGKVIHCEHCGKRGRVPYPRQAGGPEHWPQVLGVLHWILCCCWVGILGLLYVGGSPARGTAVDHAARAAETTTLVVLAYVFCRAADAAARPWLRR
jgi:DNA-directed RNA polymerase subunit RPC12/RpoP